VRFLSNRSSGKMGYALAAAARARGAEVVLVSGPTALPDPAGVRTVRVDTALAMRDAVLAEYENTDIVIKTAAVADYRFAEPFAHKMKKSGEHLTLELVKNPDILLELGEKKTHQLLIGFAAETADLLAYATEKMRKKNLDMIVANDVAEPGAGFATDTNIVTLIQPDLSMRKLPLAKKAEVAEQILDAVAELPGF
jgi:phosphopantothenoylcysteine decarboxylase/phosphopantothenate--cysteine ligase